MNFLPKQQNLDIEESRYMDFLSKQLNLNSLRVLDKTTEFAQFEGVKVHEFLGKTAEFEQFQEVKVHRFLETTEFE